MFHKKLDMLMKLTDTKNSALAMQISLDASHISRLRRGERRLVRDADYVKAMANFFSRQLGEDYRKQVVAEAMEVPLERLKDQKLLAESIHDWLVDEKAYGSEPVGRFLAGFKTNFGVKAPAGNGMIPIPKGNSNDQIRCYYGNQGKRDSVIAILTQILQEDKPITLLLYSDEAMPWMTEDNQFLMQWSYLLQKVIENGSKVRIIHTVSRNLDEMLQGLTKWMPMYMTSAIEPYYYPRKRDGVFRHTLYIAEELAAITSSSVGDHVENSLNVLVREPEAVAALTEEYYSYLALCKPLMRILNARQVKERAIIRENFRNTRTDLVIMTSRLLLDTMPHKLRERMSFRAGIDDEMPEIPRDIESHAENILAEHKAWQAIRLPQVEDIRSGMVQSELMGSDGKPICYQPDEYVEHLEYLISLLQKYDNYCIVLDWGEMADEYDLLIGEGREAIIRKATNSHVLFQIDESNLVAAFWDYFMMMIVPHNYSKEVVIRTLKELIEQID